MRYSWRLRSNGDPENFRERIGEWLRLLADRIDGRFSIAFDVRTSPAISARSYGDCLRQGVLAIGRCIEYETRSAAIEQQSREACPELWRDA